MKKAIAIMMAGLMIFSAVSCGKKAENAGEQPAAVAEETEAGEESAETTGAVGAYTKAENPTVTDEVRALVIRSL